MKLPDQAVREFQAAWLALFGEEISFEKADMEANSLLVLHSALINHEHKNKYGKPSTE